MTFTVATGVRYTATIRLGFFEKFASNELIASKLHDAGFVHVAIVGDGSERVATGEWGGATQTVELPSQIQKVEVLP